jgi:hypothetical protein
LSTYFMIGVVWVPFVTKPSEPVCYNNENEPLKYIKV